LRSDSPFAVPHLLTVRSPDSYVPGDPL